MVPDPRPTPAPAAHEDGISLAAAALADPVLSKRPAVYLAGPAVFRKDVVQHAQELRAECSRRNLRGLFPIDNLVTKDPAALPAHVIYRANCELIDAADAVVADASPFRGPSLDAGTSFEIGYAAAKGKPIFLYTSAFGSNYVQRVLAFDAGCRREGGAWRDSNGMEVESFDQHDNLMIACAARALLPTFLEALDAAAKHLAASHPAPR
eukprot:tig00000692_g3225.t1